MKVMESLHDRNNLIERSSVSSIEDNEREEQAIGMHDISMGEYDGRRMHGSDEEAGTVETPLTLTAKIDLGDDVAESPVNPSFLKTTLISLAFGLWYISMTTIQSFYNKKVFSAGFKFPVSLCFTQMVGVMVFLFLYRWILDRWHASRSSTRGIDALEEREPIFSLDHFQEKAKGMAIIGFCLALNVMLANWSLYSTDMNTFIVVRSTSIVWIALFGWLLLGMRVAPLKLLACGLVLIGSTIVGFSFARAPSSSNSTSTVSTASKAFGLMLCVGSTVVNGMMLIQMKKILTLLQEQKKVKVSGQDFDLDLSKKALPKFYRFDFLFYQSLAAAGLLFFGVIIGEGPALVRVFSDSSGDTASATGTASPEELITVLGVSSFVTIFYQLSLIGLVANTTPLGKEVISQTKVIPQTILSIILFDEIVTSSSVIGLVIAIVGLFMYSTLSYREDNPPAKSRSVSAFARKEDV